MTESLDNLPTFTDASVVPEAVSQYQHGEGGTTFETGNPDFQEKTLAKLLLYGPALVLADTVNTTVSSLGLGTYDTENFDRVLKETLPEAYDFYRTHKEGIQLTGALVGTILPVSAGLKIVNSTGKLATAMRGVPILSKALNDVQRIEKVKSALNRRDLLLGARGIRDARYASDALRTKLVNEARTLSTVKGIREGVASELMLALFQNQSDVLFPEEMPWYELALFSAGGIAAGAGLERIFLRKTIRDSARRSGTVAGIVLNPGDINVTEIISRSGSRDLSATALSTHMAALQEQRQVALQPTTFGVRQRVFAEALDRDIQQAEGQLREILQKQSAEVISDDISPAFSLSDAQINSVSRSLRDTPGNWIGVKYIQEHSTPLRNKERVEALTKKAEGLREEAKKLRESGRLADINKAAEIDKQAELFESLQPMVFRDGSFIPLEDDFLRVTDGPAPDIKHEINQLTGRASKSYPKLVDPTTGNRIDAAVDADLNLFLRGEGSLEERFERLTPFEQSSIWNLHRKFLEGESVIAPDRMIFLTKDDTYMRMDAVDEAIERGRLNPNKVRFPDDMTREEFQALILDKKFRAYHRMKNLETSGEDFGFGRTAVASPAHMRHTLNIPGGEFGDLSPLEEFFLAHRNLNSGTTLDGFSLQDIRESVSKGAVVHEGMEFADPKVKLRGDSLNPQSPAINVFRVDMDPAKLTREYLNEEMALRAGEVRQILTQGVFTKALAARITGSNAYLTAQEVDTLHQAGLVGQNILGQSRFSSRDLPPIQALHDLQTIAEKDARTFAEQLFSPHVDKFAQLRKRGNFTSQAFLGEYFNARAAGWRLEPEAKPIGTNRWGFILDKDDPLNQRRFRAKFGRELGEGVLMPATRAGDEYLPLEIDDLSYEAANAFREVGTYLYKEQNTIFRAMGLSELKFREWWAPPKNFGNQHVAYLVQTGEQGDTIKMMFRSPSRKELEEFVSSGRINQFVKEETGTNLDLASEGANSTFVVKTQEEIEQFFVARDRTFFELLDVNDVLIRRGQVSKGSSASPIPEDPRILLDEAVQGINNQINHITRDTMGLLFEGQIAYAQRANRASLTHPQTLTGARRSVFQNYQDTALGNRALRRNSNLHSFYRTIENSYDSLMLGLWEKHIGQALRHSGRQALKTTTGIDLDGKEFAKLKKELGDFLPFDNSAQFAESNFGVKMPPTMQKHAAALNRFTSGMVLRWFEIAHPLLNLSGVVTTMPAVTKALARRGGEGLEEWKSRISAYGTIVSPERELAHINPLRLFGSAIHAGFTDEGAEFLAEATRRGLIRQEVAEIQRTLNDPFATSGWRRVIDKVDHYVGMLSDRSEEWSRAWAHMGGYILGKQHGITEMDNLQIFAHRFANEVIGDYRAVNRPQIFQGAVGMPLGLFQTWTWNYYQRLFSYIENQDWRSVVTQFAMQGSVFGATTVPGYSLFNEMFVQVQDGRSTPIDAIQRAYGSEAADLLLYGTLSNIPKIFGGDGIAAYTRGDVAVRTPAFVNPARAPIVNLAKSAYEIAKGTIDSVLPGGQGLSVQRELELIGTYSNSRPAKGLFELAAGYSVDRRGNVISNDVRNAMSIATRLMGLRPMAESKAIAAKQRVKISEASAYARRARMREDVKATFRGGDFDGEALSKAFVAYLQSDGNPQNFPRFVAQAYLNATKPQARIKFMELMKSAKIQDAMRLWYAGFPGE